MQIGGGVDNTIRCTWALLDKPLYVKYHDEEWGIPLHDDCRLFEAVILDGAQAGLSWYTILRKRENYRKAYADFDIEKIASYGADKVKELLANAGIVRNKLKINSSIKNAQACLKIIEEFGSFDKYIWGFTDGKTIVNKWKCMEEMPATSPESDAMSKDMKKRGFSFVGSTILYAFMQAAGLVNDHTIDCFRYSQCMKEHRS
ncbi:MAG: DNA-3-methyladenine glycosylase I [bacterium]|nr:DNA-3-methyladenine glycosylase I [bacterium]